MTEDDAVDDPADAAREQILFVVGLALRVVAILVSLLMLFGGAASFMFDGPDGLPLILFFGGLSILVIIVSSFSNAVMRVPATLAAALGLVVCFGAVRGWFG